MHVCKYCDWQTLEPEPAVSGGLATWHVYEQHPEAWRRIVGDRPPRDPDPRIPSVRMQISGN
jgi:hypothetical protein